MFYLQSYSCDFVTALIKSHPLHCSCYKPILTTDYNQIFEKPMLELGSTEFRFLVNWPFEIFYGFGVLKFSQGGRILEETMMAMWFKDRRSEEARKVKFIKNRHLERPSLIFCHNYIILPPIWGESQEGIHGCFGGEVTLLA